MNKRVAVNSIAVFLLAGLGIGNYIFMNKSESSVNEDLIKGSRFLSAVKDH